MIFTSDERRWQTIERVLSELKRPPLFLVLQSVSKGQTVGEVARANPK